LKSDALKEHFRDDYERLNVAPKRIINWALSLLMLFHVFFAVGNLWVSSIIINGLMALIASIGVSNLSCSRLCWSE
jgi:hypothetical protein